MYDKFSLILRMETTVNDLSFFDHYRQVQHCDGATSTDYAPMKKTSYSLPPLAETLHAVHQRYLKFISDINTPDGGADHLHHLAETEIDSMAGRLHVSAASIPNHWKRWRTASIRSSPSRINL